MTGEVSTKALDEKPRHDDPQGFCSVEEFRRRRAAEGQRT